MSLPNPRKIIVDKSEYNWLCKQDVLKDLDLPEGVDSIYSQSRLYIESSVSGCALIDTIFDSRKLFGYSHRGKYVDFLAITPAVVEAVIRYAFSNGWKEYKRGKYVVTNPSIIFEEELRAALRKGAKWG